MCAFAHRPVIQVLMWSPNHVRLDALGIRYFPDTLKGRHTLLFVKKVVESIVRYFIAGSVRALRVESKNT